METIKDFVRAQYSLLIAGACMLFVVAVFFTNTATQGMGVWGKAAETYETMIDVADIETNALDYIEDADAGISYVPVIQYVSGTRRTGEVLKWKELLKVRLLDGTEVSASSENGFAIYLVDIRNSQGDSEMLVMRAQDIENLEEIPASFLYDKENAKLHLHKSGIYTVIVKIYASTGASEIYEFRLPVEAAQ